MVYNSTILLEIGVPNATPYPRRKVADNVLSMTIST